jgi:hypothetical protein
MKTSVLRLSIALAVLAGTFLTIIPTDSADAQWALVARKAMGRIQHMREGAQGGGQPVYDFASVILEAPADKVFATALDMSRKNPAVRVEMQDPGQRRLQIAEGDRTATLNVVPFDDQVSQLFIAGRAGPGEDSTTSRVVQAILRVCKEMNKHCELGG